MNEELGRIKARVAWTKQVPWGGVINLCDYVAKLEERIEAARASIEKLDRTVAAIDVNTLKRIIKLEQSITAIEERNAAIDLMQKEAMEEAKCCDPS